MLDKVTLAKQLERVQGAALIGTSGALRTTPTMTLIAILQIYPVAIGGRCIAAKFVIRLWETEHIKGPREGHSKILLPSTTSLITWTTASRKLLLPASPRHTYFREESGWSESLQNRRSELFHGWIDANEDGWGVVFCQKLSINSCYRLQDQCCVSQAEASLSFMTRRPALRPNTKQPNLAYCRIYTVTN